MRYYAYKGPMKNWPGSWAICNGPEQLLYIKRPSKGDPILVYRNGTIQKVKDTLTMPWECDAWEQLSSKPTYHDEFSHWVYWTRRKKKEKKEKKNGR